ncbi:cell adhesion molecule 2-like isoform X1 [Hypomesus transpacificus]|uniref:cell adhesion molecule 2-like isoform X1 n=1 Tax=Hypomesus transpacificus TaxID=137520 RepID=UPI001F083C9F|nr:cell adhesion molecule 2-like isoform X1 [Hypomesus transpacificus]
MCSTPIQLRQREREGVETLDSLVHQSRNTCCFSAFVAGIPLILETTEAPLRGFTGRHTSETTAVTIMGASVDESSFYVLGGVIAAVAVLLLCITVLGLQYMFKHKGSYLTNEEDEYESIENTDIELQKDTDLLEAVGEQ